MWAVALSLNISWPNLKHKIETPLCDIWVSEIERMFGSGWQLAAGASLWKKFGAFEAAKSLLTACCYIYINHKEVTVLMHTFDKHFYFLVSLNFQTSNKSLIIFIHLLFSEYSVDEGYTSSFLSNYSNYCCDPALPLGGLRDINSTISKVSRLCVIWTNFLFALTDINCTGRAVGLKNLV